MVDDIDDLLDEVEAGFTKSPSVTTPNKKVTSSHKQARKDDELNTLIDDICDIPEPLSFEKCNSSLSTNSTASHKSDSKKKCFVVYIGGKSIPFGLTTTANQRACDQMRCTACDFKISVFEDFVWTKSTDYLFLRNNMPDFSRLKANLTHKSGWRAYACQCKWRNVNQIQDVSSDKELKWVCGRHT